VITNSGEFARPLEQVLDEVEQAVVGPLHVLEDHRDRVDVGQALDEEAPRCKEVVPLEPRALLVTEQVPESRLDEAALLVVADMLADDVGELLERRRRLFVLCDPGAHSHHVGQGPVGDALAVCKAPASVPVRHLGQPVHVLVELPGEPRLADPGNARDRHQLLLAVVDAGVEEILDAAKLAVAADERSFEPRGLERAARARDDTAAPRELDEADPCLQLVRAGVLVDDRLVGGRRWRSPTSTVPGSAATGSASAC
jgi:hypothetical protein